MVHRAADAETNDSRNHCASYLHLHFAFCLLSACAVARRRCVGRACRTRLAALGLTRTVYGTAVPATDPAGIHAFVKRLRLDLNDLFGCS
jgi:hypothetical protein